MKSFLAACAILALSTAPLAAAPHWIPLGPYGGPVDSLTVDPVQPQVLYATDSLQGTFKSVNGGASWILIHAGMASSNVAVDPSRHTTIYQSLNTMQVWKSTDGGVTWLRVGNLILNGLVFSAGGGTLWGVRGTQVFASHDGAASWESVGGPPVFNISRLVPDPIDPGRLFAATSGGIWVFQSSGFPIINHPEQEASC
jgi:hypothetical protein